MKKIFCSIAIAVIIISVVFSVSCTAYAVGNRTAEQVFGDIDGDEWYASAADFVYQRSIMTGTDSVTFSPSTTLSRAQFAVILYRMNGSVSGNGKNFPDVASGTWYSDAVSWASSVGVITGYENGYFYPANAITREQFAAMLYRYAAYSGLDISASDNLSSFRDCGNVSTFALAAMKWCVGSGIISGRTGTTLAPQGTCSRAECAMMLMRYFGTFDTESFAPKSCSDTLFCNQRGILTVSGWAYDRNDPEEPLSVDVYINNEFVTSFAADQARTDINSSLGISGNHGYDAEIDLSDYSGNISVTVNCVSARSGQSALIVSKVVTVTRYVGHRGYSAAAPENTVRSFTLAGQAGFWGCETDVWPTADGEFICMHDSTFYRMCGVSETPGSMTLNEIRQLTITAGSNLSAYTGDEAATRVPTLEEYLNVCKTYDMVPFIEIKSGPHTSTAVLSMDQIAALYSKVKAVTGNSRVFFIGYDYDNMVNMRNYLNSVGENNIDLQFLTESPETADYQRLSSDNIGIDAYYTRLTDDLIVRANGNGINIGAWTCDNSSKALELLQKGCYSITTNTKQW